MKSIKHVTIWPACGDTISASPEGAGPVQGGPVHALRFAGPGDVVVYSSMQAGHKAKEHLTGRLLGALALLEPCYAALLDQGPLLLAKDPLGRPFLVLEDMGAPFLSFTHAEERTWAALSGRRRPGIDVAYPEDFHGAYPFARVFKQKEFDSVMELCRNNSAQAAALLWSLKEAAVKAMGCGFNLFDPLDVEVRSPEPCNGGFLFWVMAGRLLPTWVKREGRAWLSFAFNKEGPFLRDGKGDTPL